MYQYHENVRQNGLHTREINKGDSLTSSSSCLGLLVSSEQLQQTLSLAVFTSLQENNEVGHSAVVKGVLIACRVSVKQA